MRKLVVVLLIAVSALLLVWVITPEIEPSGLVAQVEGLADDGATAPAGANAHDVRVRRPRHDQRPGETDPLSVPVVVPGIVIGVDRKPIEHGVQVIAQLAGSAARHAGDLMTVANPDGTFEVQLPTPGVWRLRATSSNGSASSAWSTVSTSERPGAPVPAIALLLRRTIRVIGRATDTSGAVAPGARVRVSMAHDIASAGEGGWSPREGATEVITLATDSEGHFEAVMRAGSAAWAHTVSSDGVVGARVQKSVDLASGGTLDLGDVELAGSAGRSRWDLRVIDDAGPVDGEMSLWMLDWDRVFLEEHPQYDSELLGVMFEASDSVIDLDLPVRERPVVVAVGGVDHVAQAFVLDCSAAGDHVVELALARRRVGVVRVLGEAARQAGSEGLLEVSPRGMPRSRTCVDARTGNRVAMPDLRSPARTPHARIRPPSPAATLEHRFKLRGDRVTPLGDGTFQVVGWDQDSLRLVIRIGDQVVAHTAAALGPPADAPETLVDLSGGRLLELDTSAMRAAVAESRISTALPGSFSVVPVVPEDPRSQRADAMDGRPLPELPELVRPVPLLTTRAALEDAPFWLWVPAGTTALSFGGPSAPGENQATIEVGVSVDGDPIAVPDPTRLLRESGLVRCELVPSLTGVGSAMPGVNIQVQSRYARTDESFVDLYVRSGRDGVAITWLPPGHYSASVAVDAGAVAREENLTEFDVAPGGGATSIAVPYSIRRQ